MIIIKRGNVYKRAGWLKEHERELLLVGCTIISYFLIVLTVIMI